MEVDNTRESSNDVQISNWNTIPKPVWNIDRKMFFLYMQNMSFLFLLYRVPEPWQLPLTGKGDSKATLFIDRYNMILQRLKRSAVFSGAREGFQLTTIDSLIGSHGKKFLFGMLTQLKEGKYYLEDPKGTVLLDLSKAQYSSGLFCEV